MACDSAGNKYFGRSFIITLGTTYLGQSLFYIYINVFIP